MTRFSRFWVFAILSVEVVIERALNQSMYSAAGEEGVANLDANTYEEYLMAFWSLRKVRQKSLEMTR